MSQFLLTGGEGFIGFHIAKLLLEQGHQVASYDSNRTWIPSSIGYYHKSKLIRDEELEGRVQRFLGDTNDQDRFSEALNEFQPEYVIHLAGLPLAGESNKFPKDARETILDGTQTVLNCLKQYTKTHSKFRRFTFISSSMVYGDFALDPLGNPIPAKETDPLNSDKSFYAGFKEMGEIITRTSGHIFHIPYTIVRPSAVYGPTDCNRRVVEIFIDNALQNTPLVLDNEGTLRVDFTYVQDTAQGIILATTQEQGINQTFNITAGNSRTLEELAQIIASHIPSVQVQKKKGTDSFRPARGTLDIAKARKLLGYSPKHSLEKGVKLYLEHVIKHGYVPNISAEVLRGVRGLDLSR